MASPNEAQISARGAEDYLSASARPRRSGSRLAKLASLTRLAVVNPIECADRVRGLLELRLRALARRRAIATQEIATWETFARRAAEVLRPVEPWSQIEAAFLESRAALARRFATLGPTPYPAELDADPLLARLAFFLTTMLRPSLVVETGVALGVTTFHVLAALERIGGDGRLVSIDRPPLGVNCESVGRLVPDEFRDRWTLHIGTSARVLPRVLPNLPPVGLFIQDSVFTPGNVRRELSQICQCFAARWAILANGADQNDGPAWLRERTPVALSVMMRAQEKCESISVAVGC